ncbi:hydantoinase B/oxoprolinase family protein [Sphingomonas crocodyli]|uniref:Hydantoinase B/oxoprolinase family protein n=1 Tax=Sphingomonas crocodyli TaxID=1979270 RepID=A0A437M5F2_9SPHN|nr:hydantoinase B/oxoprolinase family protein [Sphingomonas crocodyli]RVT92918.1 hydantoinase B/oxoprolinase family protein [Sphingomonas crocodyli]
MSANFSIDRDVFQHQLVGIAEEMSRALRRSAFSAVIWDSYDYACGIFTPEGEMLAQAETIASQLGTMSTAYGHIRQRIPLEQWKPGDVFICNDPYKGCTHTPDITLFSPIFNDGEIIGVASTIAHHLDIGGRFPGTTVADNVEVYAEGLIFPQIRFIDGGVQNETAVEFIRSNVRFPDICLGDLRAQVAGCRTAERRLAELAALHGNETFRRLAAATLNYGEAYARGMVERIADGRYEAETLLEDGIASEDNIRLHVVVTIEGSSIKVDFAGSSDQRPAALNCPWSSTISMTNYALKCVVAPDTPQNGGFNRVFSVEAPLGSVLNPRKPAAVAARHFVQQGVADVILKALSEAVPERSAAGSQISFPVFRASGVDDRPGRLKTGEAVPFTVLDLMGGGMGGSVAHDGLDAVDTHGSNCSLISAEVMESLGPVRVLRSALVPNSGGEGQHRGGLALERVYEFLTDSAAGWVRLQQRSAETAPWGGRGGKAGSPSLVVYNPDTDRERGYLSPRENMLSFGMGDKILVRSAGGGGFGSPQDRPEAERVRDQQEGYV